LPDGSKVWLNAASTLRFPIAFAGNERHVQLTGEAYFEIKSQKIPFTVDVNGMKVAVLGTHFNVMAYSDEQAVKTTLLEGAVEISKDGARSLLKPGQEASFDPSQAQGSGQALIRVTQANGEQATAWKDGFFDFEGMDVQGVLRQVARWYNVEVENGNSLPARQFGGKISRNAPMADVLKVLEANNIRVRVEPEHRKIVILN
jgi:ferric-dicitrate binding protein FerR (iron transport regulator)